ncbi:hypothetical protein MYCGRDRAFT_85021 [Paecilomyces variotii No. 5]|uniref:Short-chain dehydrogenase n=1 Tax=Byssochlamys spectabilis (strain No. 5 / NBRC 109023) TaxID=1356009 RepID=V5FYU1_BYSSN|nr:hypothetical protein MYCGRDRAFT_85021 [Paecilomyces variotii No. 5]
MSDKTFYTSRLSGKRIVVFGGTSGIGFCVAEASIENGATVIISSSNEEKIYRTISRITESYPSAKGRISGHVVDLSNPSTVDSDIARFFEKIGPVDHIVFTAGDKPTLQPLEACTVETMQQGGMVRVFAAILVAKHALKYLAKSNKSSLTLTSGAAAEKPSPSRWVVGGMYAGGLYSLVKTLAREMAPVRVNLVSPGPVDTELFKSAEIGQEILQNMAKTLPVGQVGEPQDIAEAYLYLMKDKAATGSVIASNGGWTLV